jgi:hypothetical protein
MKLHLKFILLITALFFSAHAYAQSEGGHTGNGGGVIFCAGKKPLVLDYYEIPSPREDVIDLENISRDAFIQLIEARIRSASDPMAYLQNQWWIDRTKPVPVLDKAISLFLHREGSVDQWKTTQAWPVRDEAIVDSLPSECEFIQGAISRDHTPYQISAVTKTLSEGQKRVLELHEALFTYADYYSTFIYNGTSASVRKLVRVFIRKNPTVAELKAALDEFAQVEKKATKSILYRQTGLYILDLRFVDEIQKANLRNCPTWLGLVPTVDQDAYLYRFSNRKSLSIEEFLLPHETKALLQKSIEVHSEEGFYRRTGVRHGEAESVIELRFSSPSKMLPTLFFQENGQKTCSYVRIDETDFFVTPTLQKDESFVRKPVRLVKNLIEHFEAKKRGLPSRFQRDVDALRATYGHSR